MVADVKILFQLQGMNQRAAVGAFRPKSFGHVFTSVMAAQARFAENSHKGWKLRSLTSGLDGLVQAAKLITCGDHDNPLLKDLPDARIDLLGCYSSGLSAKPAEELISFSVTSNE